ncbi:MAG: glutathione S-transferase family protein [Aliidongia sp.]
MTEPYKLYGAHLSYYTGKTRAHLLYKGVPFVEHLSTRAAYLDVIVPRTGVRYIPVLISPDDIAVQDTSEIADFIESRFPAPSIYPSGPRQRLAAQLFEIHGDEWLVLPAMLYRWLYNREFATLGFGAALHPEADLETQREAGAKACAPFAGALPFLGVSEASRPGIEAEYLEFLDLFAEHLKHHPFLLGTRPSIGDFGLMGPLYAHLLRDPRSGEIMHLRTPRVVNWIERMNFPVPNSGEFLPDDDVPATLMPLLRHIFARQWPVIADTIRLTAAWIDAKGEAELPRVIGQHLCRIGGVETPRAVFPYTQWMWQRAADVYAGLDTAERGPVDAWLDALGGLAAFRTPIPHRVERRQNRLMPA